MDNFDLKKYLTENKLTKGSQLNEINLALPAEYKKELDDEVKNVIDLFNNDLKKGQIKGTKDIDGYVNKMDSKLNSVLKYFKGDDEALESLNKYAEKIYNKAYDYFYDTIEKRDFPEKSTKKKVSEVNLLKKPFPGSTPKYSKFKLEWEIPGEEYSSLVVSNLKSINDVIDEKGIKKYKVLGWDGAKWKTIINYIN